MNSLNFLASGHFSYQSNSLTIDGRPWSYIWNKVVVNRQMKLVLISSLYMQFGGPNISFLYVQLHLYGLFMIVMQWKSSWSLQRYVGMLNWLIWIPLIFLSNFPTNRLPKVNTYIPNNFGVFQEVQVNNLEVELKIVLPDQTERPVKVAKSYQTQDVCKVSLITGCFSVIQKHDVKSTIVCLVLYVQNLQMNCNETICISGIFEKDWNKWIIC